MFKEVNYRSIYYYFFMYGFFCYDCICYRKLFIEIDYVRVMLGLIVDISDESNILLIFIYWNWLKDDVYFSSSEEGVKFIRSKNKLY